MSGQDNPGFRADANQDGSVASNSRESQDEVTSNFTSTSHHGHCSTSNQQDVEEGVTRVVVREENQHSPNANGQRIPERILPMDNVSGARNNVPTDGEKGLCCRCNKQQIKTFRVWFIMCLLFLVACVTLLLLLGGVVVGSTKEEEAGVHSVTETIPTRNKNIVTALRNIRPAREPDSALTGKISNPESDIDVQEPVIHGREPIVHDPEHIIHGREPIFIDPDTVIHFIGPALPVPEPAFEVPEPADEAPEPAFKAPEPAFEAPEPTFEDSELDFEDSELDFEDSKLDFEDSELDFEAPEPAFEVPEPVFEIPEFHFPIFL